MDQGVLLSVIETLLRVALGLRILHSGVSNVVRWPNPTKNTRLIFPFGATFFAVVAVFLMVAGGLGLALGFQTRPAAAMIALFLVPTLKIQFYWLRELPAVIEEVNRAVPEEPINGKFRLLAQQALHSHETGWKNNLVLLFAALFFALRGSVAFGLDNLLR